MTANDEPRDVPHGEYARMKTGLYRRIDTLKARAEAAEAALVELTHIHHTVLTPSRLHDPHLRGWPDCGCRTCKRTAELVPDAADEWRRCECRARGLIADGTPPAEAMCTRAAECESWPVATGAEEPHGHG